MGKTLGLDKSGPRREVVRLLRSGTEVILYITKETTIVIISVFQMRQSTTYWQVDGEKMKKDV